MKRMAERTLIPLYQLNEATPRGRLHSMVIMRWFQPCASQISYGKKCNVA